MAKNFPYFKFTVTEWMTGDIVYESFAVQGLFINICALYWQRDGSLTLDDINKRFKNPPELKELTDRFFSVTDGFISIAFLDEQLTEVNHISTRNSINGSLGGRPKGSKIQEKKPTANRPLSDSKAKKSKEEEEKEQEEEKNKNKREIRREGEFNLEFVDPRSGFLKFIDYRKKIHKEFKTQMSVEHSYKSLMALSNRNMEVAEQIIDQSIANDWAGLFELKEKNSAKKENYGNSKSDRQARSNSVDEITRIANEHLHSKGS